MRKRKDLINEISDIVENQKIHLERKQIVATLDEVYPALWNEPLERINQLRKVIKSYGFHTQLDAAKEFDELIIERVWIQFYKKSGSLLI